MARRVEKFEEGATRRRYDWANWVDGVWEILQGEDYDVPTENMRVNLHERAKVEGKSVRTTIIRKDGREGLRFEFFENEGRPASPRQGQTARRRYPVGNPRSY
jgi:hypothetical protein